MLLPAVEIRVPTLRKYSRSENLGEGKANIAGTRPPSSAPTYAA